MRAWSLVCQSSARETAEAGNLKMELDEQQRSGTHEGQRHPDRRVGRRSGRHRVHENSAAHNAQEADLLSKAFDFSELHPHYDPDLDDAARQAFTVAMARREEALKDFLVLAEAKKQAALDLIPLLHAVLGALATTKDRPEGSCLWWFKARPRKQLTKLLMRALTEPISSDTVLRAVTASGTWLALSISLVADWPRSYEALQHALEHCPELWSHTTDEEQAFLAHQIKSDPHLLRLFHDETVRVCRDDWCPTFVDCFGLSHLPLPLTRLADDVLVFLLQEAFSADVVCDMDTAVYDSAEMLCLYRAMFRCAEADDDCRFEFLGSIPESMWSQVMSVEQCEWVLQNPGRLLGFGHYRISYLHYLLSLLRYATMLGQTRRLEILCTALPNTTWEDVSDCQHWDARLCEPFHVRGLYSQFSEQCIWDAWSRKELRAMATLQPLLFLDPDFVTLFKEFGISQAVRETIVSLEIPPGEVSDPVSIFFSLAELACCDPPIILSLPEEWLDLEPDIEAGREWVLWGKTCWHPRNHRAMRSFSA